MKNASALIFGMFLLSATACSSSLAPAPPTLRGVYEAQGPGPLDQIAFLDDTSYALRSNDACEEPGEDPCFHSGTYSFRADGVTLDLTDNRTGEVTSMPIAVASYQPAGWDAGTTLTDDESIRPEDSLTNNAGSGGSLVTNGGPIDKPGGTALSIKTDKQLLGGPSSICKNPPLHNCDFYATCLEKAKPCGASGYALGFGKKYCDRYFADTGFSAKGVAWVSRVGNCLQRALLKYGDPSNPPKESCQQIYSIAYKSHPSCYVDGYPGICDLSFSDMANIRNVIDIKDAANFQSLQVAATCAALMMACPHVGDGPRTVSDCTTMTMSFTQDRMADKAPENVFLPPDDPSLAAQAAIEPDFRARYGAWRDTAIRAYQAGDRQWELERD